MKQHIGLPFVAMSFSALEYINMIAGILAIAWYGYMFYDRIKYGPKQKMNN